MRVIEREMTVPACKTRPPRKALIPLSSRHCSQEDAPLASDKPSGKEGGVFSCNHTLASPLISLSADLGLNRRLQMDGRTFLQKLPEGSFPVAFFDPQYRRILDKMRYGNEGRQRGKKQHAVPHMTEQQIGSFIQGIDRALMPSGHLFLWMDKFLLCTGFQSWLSDTSLELVDMITWNKQKMGMGYRSRRVSEHVVVLQRKPRRAKGVWQVHDIPDVWGEGSVRSAGSVHPKPVHLQARLIEAVSNVGDIVIDPAAGSFSVLKACDRCSRNFLGCDILC